MSWEQRQSVGPYAMGDGNLCKGSTLGAHLGCGKLAFAMATTNPHDLFELASTQLAHATCQPPC